MKGLYYSMKRLNQRAAAVEVDNVAVVKQVINLTGRSVTVAAAGAGVGFGTTLLGKFPVGNLLFYAAVVEGARLLTTSANITSATWDGDWAIGTAADANGTLAAGEVDLIPSFAIGPATAKLSPIQNPPPVAFAPTYFDNTDGTLNPNFNLLVDAGDIADASSALITFTQGKAIFLYSVLSDD